MHRLADIHEASLAIETTLTLLRQPDTDEKQARAALLDIYLAGFQKARDAHGVSPVDIRDGRPTAHWLSKVALEAISRLEKELAQ